MSFKPFKQLKVAPDAEVSPKVVNDLQYNIAVALGQLLGKDPLDLAFVRSVTLQPGIINKVAHTLGRKMQGAWPVRTHGSYALLTDLNDINPSPHLTYWVTSPVLVTVDFLFF